MSDYYVSLIQKYGIVSIEDPFDQDDWEGWTHFTAGSGIQVVGDDLTVTNPTRIQTYGPSCGVVNCPMLIRIVQSHRKEIVQWTLAQGQPGKSLETLSIAKSDSAWPDRYRYRIYQGVSVFILA